MAGAELDLWLRLEAAGRAGRGEAAGVGGAAARWIARAHPERWGRGGGFGDLWGWVAGTTGWRGGAGGRSGRSGAGAGGVHGRLPGAVGDVRREGGRGAAGAGVVGAGRVERPPGSGRARRRARRPRRLPRGRAAAARRASTSLLLAARHPLRCLADLRSRRRWRAEEEAWPLRALAPAARRLRAGGERHLHVHFAGLAALHAMRLARIAGVTYSVAPHGYDVFAGPRNLAEKLDGAAARRRPERVHGAAPARGDGARGAATGSTWS